MADVTVECTLCRQSNKQTLLLLLLSPVNTSECTMGRLTEMPTLRRLFSVVKKSHSQELASHSPFGLNLTDDTAFV